MKKDLIKTEINVNDNKIDILKMGNTDYISLTDLASCMSKWLVKMAFLWYIEYVKETCIK